MTDNLSMTTVSPSEAKVLCKAMWRLRRPVFLHGKSGIGKSDIVRQVAAEISAEDKITVDLIDFRVSLRDPVDLIGLPNILADRTKWNIPDWLPTEGYGILLLDEINHGSIAMQHACFQLVWDRKLGDYELPPGWVVFAAGNRAEDKAAIVKTPAPLNARFAHLNVEPSLEAWTEWAINHDVTTEVLAFVRFRDELLHRFDPQHDTQAFPNPRAWAGLSDIVASNTVPQELEHKCFSGIVGPSASAEFLAFRTMFKDMPNIDRIIAKPDQAAVPAEPGTMYAVATALGRRMDEDNIGNIVTYLGRMPKEFSVMAMTDAIKRDETLKSTRGFINWAADNSDVLF